MKKIALCAGSFDPPTLGHINIIQRGLELFDTIVVAVAINTGKTGLLPISERVALLKQLFAKEKNVRITSFDGLLVDFARKEKIHHSLRGIRNITDYAYESQMAQVNKAMYPKLETVFLMTDRAYAHIQSSSIREILRFGGSCKGMIPKVVETTLRQFAKGEVQ